MTALPAGIALPLTAAQFAALPREPEVRYELQEGAIVIAGRTPLTVADFLALPQDDRFHYELQEGAVVVAARPLHRRQVALSRLAGQLDKQLPSDRQLLLQVDVDLQLNPADQAGFVRVPDLVVVTAAANERGKANGGMLRACDVVLAVEIRADVTERTDAVLKHREYADAGIGHYWMVDLTDRPSLTACHRAGEFGYADADPVQGEFTTDFPFPARIDLDRLR